MALAKTQALHVLHMLLGRCGWPLVLGSPQAVCLPCMHTSLGGSTESASARLFDWSFQMSREHLRRAKKPRPGTFAEAGGDERLPPSSANTTVKMYYLY